MLSRVVHLLNRKTILIILVLTLVLGTYTFDKYGGLIFSNISNIATVLSIIIAALLLCVKSPKTYFIFVYIKALLIGEQTLWNLSANFVGDISYENFTKLKAELQDISRRANIHLDKGKIFKATLDGINVVLSLSENIDSEEEYQKLHFQIIDFRAAYEDTLSTLEGVILPYLRKTDHIIKPIKSDFELCINFIHGNPWAKAISKGINYENILTMDFIISVDKDNTKGRIAIGKKDLRITCEELNILATIIKNRLIPSA